MNGTSVQCTDKEKLQTSLQYQEGGPLHGTRVGKQESGVDRKHMTLADVESWLDDNAASTKGTLEYNTIVLDDDDSDDSDGTPPTKRQKVEPSDVPGKAIPRTLEETFGSDVPDTDADVPSTSVAGTSAETSKGDVSGTDASVAGTSAETSQSDVPGTDADVPSTSVAGTSAETSESDVPGTIAGVPSTPVAGTSAKTSNSDVPGTSARYQCRCPQHSCCWDICRDI